MHICVSEVTSLLVSYTPPGNLGSCMAGGVIEYEMRYSRTPAAMHEDRRSAEPMPLVGWVRPSVGIRLRAEVP